MPANAVLFQRHKIVSKLAPSENKGATKSLSDFNISDSNDMRSENCMSIMAMLAGKQHAIKETIEEQADEEHYSNCDASFDQEIDTVTPKMLKLGNSKKHVRLNTI